MNKPRKPNMTNKSIADQLNLDHSMVSKLRSGQRNPSWATMVKIEREFGWPIGDQVTAVIEDVYPAWFEDYIDKAAHR